MSSLKSSDRHGDGAAGGIVLVHGDYVVAAAAVDEEAAGFSQIEFEGSAERRLPAYALRHAVGHFLQVHLSLLGFGSFAISNASHSR